MYVVTMLDTLTYTIDLQNEGKLKNKNQITLNLIKKYAIL